MRDLYFSLSMLLPAYFLHCRDDQLFAPTPERIDAYDDSLMHRYGQLVPKILPKFELDPRNRGHVELAILFAEMMIDRPDATRLNFGANYYAVARRFYGEENMRAAVEPFSESALARLTAADTEPRPVRRRRSRAHPAPVE